MVFIRHVSKLVRPVMLGRCISPVNAPTTCIVASYPRIVLSRSQSTTIASSFTANPASSASGAPFSLNEPSGMNASTTEEFDTPTFKFNAPNSHATIEANFEELMARSSPAPMESYEVVFKQLAENRDLRHSIEYLNRLKEKGIHPSDQLYSYVVRSGRRALKAREMRSLFGEELRREQERGEDARPSASFDSMRQVMEMMKTDGAKLTVEFYDDLADTLAFSQQGGLMINIAVAMEKRGEQPSTHFYNKMLYALPRCNLSDRADILFSRMVMNNLADRSSYVYRIGSLVATKRIKDAEICFKEMQKIYGLNEVACNTMIHGYLESRDLTSALRVLDQMKESIEAKPNNITANTFMTYFYSSSDLVAAPQILEYFAQSIGFPSQPSDYAALYRLFARHDEPRAEKLVAQVMADKKLMDVNFFNAVLHSYGDRKVRPDFKQNVAMIILKSSGEGVTFKPDGMAAICINASPDFRQTLARMEQEGIQPTGVTFDLAMRTARYRADWDAIILLYRRLQTMTMALHNSHRNYYLEALIAKGDVVRVQALAKSMMERKNMIYDINIPKLQAMGIPVPSLQGSRDRSMNRASTKETYSNWRPNSGSNSEFKSQTGSTSRDPHPF